MIYALHQDLYPTPGQFIEEIKYVDENDFEWRICRVQNGFFVRFFGNGYFKEKYFSIQANGKSFLINNTGCLFIQDSDFETFALMRETIKSEYTDDIWDTIKEMFEERFLHDTAMIESEIVKS